ncbi:MAG: hypothetical protein V1724_04945, partial [Chloroflexota bacterium]
LVALVAVLVLPVGVALAGSDTPSFTAQTTLVQNPLAGTVTPVGVIAYVCSDFSLSPTFCESNPPLVTIGIVPAAVVQTGEVFNGTFTGCEGQQCSQIQGSAIAVTQGSVISFAGFGPNYGDVRYVGSVGGTFVITKQAGKSVHTLSGAYSGTVDVTINLFTNAISGTHGSTWQATDATGGFNSLKRASGEINAPIGGFFPGYEVAVATVTGAHHSK